MVRFINCSQFLILSGVVFKTSTAVPPTFPPTSFPSAGSSPCSSETSKKLTDENKDTLLALYGLDKTIVGCFDTSEVTNLGQLFYNSNYNADLSSWDVSSVTSMWRMFASTYVFNGDISTWDVSSVTNMIRMFHKAPAFNNDISSCDVSSIAAMAQMFDKASVFNSDVSSWDVTAATAIHVSCYTSQYLL